jgi:hypothetical protein
MEDESIFLTFPNFRQTLLVVKGGSNTGKSSSIKLAYEMLSGNQVNSGEVDKKITYGKIKIAFCSSGDTVDIIEKHIQEHNDCDIIVTACRLFGSTPDYILTQYGKYRVLVVGSAWGKSTKIQKRNNLYVAKQICLSINGLLVQYF